MAKKKEEKPEPRLLTDMSGLGTYDYNVDIELTDGETVRIPMKTLSLKAWNEAGADVADPVPPINGVDKFERPIHDHSDPTYARLMNEAANLRAYKRLLVALKIDVPGETDAERIEWLETELDFGVAQTLVEVMAKQASDVEARVAKRAASFPANGASDT